MNNSLKEFSSYDFDSSLTIYPGHDNFIKLSKLLQINPYLK